MIDLKKILLIVQLFIVCTLSNAQIRDFGRFATTGAADAQELFEAYITPYFNGFGASLTGSWYNTAKPHKLGGFDITFSLNSAMVPESDRTYLVENLDLENLQHAPGGELVSPTMAGIREAGPLMQYNISTGDSTFTADAFNLPAGTAIPYTPAPMLQAAVGLIKGTEIIGRFVPKVGNDKGKLGLWGVGLKHDIKQWIPGFNKTPVINLSIMGGYTRFNSIIQMAVTPGMLNLQNFIDVPSETWDNQSMIATISSFTSNIVISADLSVVTFYGGAGFAITNSNIRLEGNYPVISDIDENGPVVTALNNPLDITIKNYEGGVTKPRINAGVRLKLAIFTIHLDYTWANYSMASLGLGFSFK